MSSSPLDQIALHERTRREILHKSDLIPSLPETVTEVLRLLNDKGAEIPDFEEVLSTDTALVAKMLRVVNSPFYGMMREITSIQEAVMVLGFRSLRSLVLAASTAKYMERDYTCYGHEGRGLWKHAMAVASAARTLAKEAGLGAEDREEIFVEGLLHDIGKMLLGPYLVEREINVAKQAGKLCKNEVQALGIDHPEAGAIVAKKWNLSERIQEVIKKHETQEQPEDATCAKHLAVVRLAGAYCHGLGIGYAESTTPQVLVLPSDLALLGFDIDDWDEAQYEMKEAVESALDTLGSLGG